MNRSGGTSSLLFVLALLAGCGSGGASRPDLPASVSPGWSLAGMQSSAAPAGLPSTGMPPVCWKADYKGDGAATVWVCGYRASGSAFDALQRMASEPSQVKFQKGVYLVAVQWTGSSQASITALVVALQKQLP